MTMAQIALAIALLLIRPAATSADDVSCAAYFHPDQCFPVEASFEEREAAIAACLDAVVQADLTAIVPYVSTTSGAAHYPSRFLKEHRWGKWDPIEVFVREARSRKLRVVLCVPVLACGHKSPAGILLEHPEWALRDNTGQPVGSISPGHPEARKWILSWLEEIAMRYQPDGLLLDYMRYSSLPTKLDTASAAREDNWLPKAAPAAAPAKHQQFREFLLTELMEQISTQLRKIDRDLHIAIYSWGHHVTSGHRVAQDWPTWAKRGYIDEVNVCGYWYPKTYPKRWGNDHIDAFRTVLVESRQLLQKSGSDTNLTFALGIRTSHGQVRTVVDIAGYLNEATQQQIDGVTFFTWSYLVPFLPQLKTWKVLSDYQQKRLIPDLTTANKQSVRQISHQVDAASSQQRQSVAGTVFVATADSSLTSRQAADFAGDGTGDQEQINQAIQSLPAIGGTVQLAEGTYDIRRVGGTLGGVLIDRSRVVIAGCGPSTKLILAAHQNTNVIRIIGSGIQNVTIRDLSIDANRDENKEGIGDPNISHDRFEYCGIKGYCRDPRGPGADDLQHITVRNCEVRNAHRLGIMLEGSDLKVIDNHLGNAGSDVVELLTGPGMIRGNVVEITGQTHVAIGSDRGNSIQMSDNIIHVRPGGKLNIGFRTWADSQHHVISGNLLVVDDGGHCELGMDLRGRMQTVSGNIIEASGMKTPSTLRIGGGNTVLTGNLLRNVVVEVNDTYDNQLPIRLQTNIMHKSPLRHLKGNLINGDN